MPYNIKNPKFKIDSKKFLKKFLKINADKSIAFARNKAEYEFLKKTEVDYVFYLKRLRLYNNSNGEKEGWAKQGTKAVVANSKKKLTLKEFKSLECWKPKKVKDLQIIDEINNKYQGRYFAIAGNKKEFKKLKLSDCDIIYYQKNKKFYNNANGERKGFGKKKPVIESLQNSISPDYNDLDNLNRYFTNTKDFLEEIGIKKADKIAGWLNKDPARGLEKLETFAEKNSFESVLWITPNPDLSYSEWWADKIYKFQANYYSEKNR